MNRDAMRRLEGRISAETMRRLNGDVQLRHRPSEQVAAAFLREAVGSAPPAVRSDGLVARILRRTGEHLVLVGLALLGAIAVAVPLGIAARGRAHGR